MTSPPTESPPWDALLVIHPGTDLGRIRASAAGRGWRTVQILCSHQPFEQEQTALEAALRPARVRVMTFPDLLDDATLARIDEATTAELLAAGTHPAAYTRAFQERMQERRNEAAHQGLPAGRPGAPLLADRGRGLSERYWRRQGARTLAPGPGLAAWFTDSALRRMLRAWRESRRLPRKGSRVRGAEGDHVFLGSVRRLALRPGTGVDTVELDARVLSEAAWLATTIHDHPPACGRLGRTVRVFSDGYLPSNYSRSYLDSYGPAEFVACDPFAARWLRRHGRTVVKTPAFIEGRPLAVRAAGRTLRTVVVLGGHGGDWSALVDRSDNDRLMRLAAALAEAFPSLLIRIRLHPTMDHPDHDGPGARARIAGWIAGRGCPNLALSTLPWADDLAHGDAFISEYSATLIDAWQAGRAGLIANVTGRRSFMQDFADLGFAYTTDASGAISWLRELDADPRGPLGRQGEAARRYNELLANCLSP